MKRYVKIVIGVVLLICCLSSCKLLSNDAESDTEGSVSIKPEGDTFLYVEKMFSGDVMQMDDDISIKISYGCNLPNETIPEGTDAKLIISSEQVDIEDGSVIYEDISDGKCERDKGLTYMFTFPKGNITCNAGKILFEFQLLDKDGEVFSFCNKDIYFALKDDEIYLGGVCMEEVADYLASGHDIYYDSIQGVDFFNECFWYDKSEKLIYFFGAVENELKLKQYSYEMSDKDIVVRDKDGQIIFTIQYVQKDQMKINDKAFYCIDEELW